MRRASANYKAGTAQPPKWRLVSCRKRFRRQTGREPLQLRDPRLLLTPAKLRLGLLPRVLSPFALKLMSLSFPSDAAMCGGQACAEAGNPSVTGRAQAWGSPLAVRQSLNVWRSIR